MLWPVFFSSSDLAIFDGFGDDPQEADEDTEGKDNDEQKSSDDKDDKEKSTTDADSSSPVKDVSAALAATNLTTAAKEGSE